MNSIPLGDMRKGEMPWLSSPKAKAIPESNTSHFGGVIPDMTSYGPSLGVGKPKMAFLAGRDP